MVATTKPQVYIRESVPDDIKIKDAIHKVVNAAYRSGKNNNKWLMKRDCLAGLALAHVQKNSLP